MECCNSTLQDLEKIRTIGRGEEEVSLEDSTSKMTEDKVNKGSGSPTLLTPTLERVPTTKSGCNPSWIVPKATSRPSPTTTNTSSSVTHTH